MKQKIAKYLLYITLAFVAVSYLPWVYLTIGYYILRYAIMACMATSLILTFSIEKYFSERFMRLFAVTIILVTAEFLFFYLAGRHFRLADLSQLIIAFLCIGIGMTLDNDIKNWANICYYYTLGLIVMGVLNCFYWAGGLYIPEHYMLDEGKNQVGGLIAIAGTTCFFFGIKIKEQRTHFLVLFILSLLVLLLIRARSDCFAMLLCTLFVGIKDCNWKWKWNLKTVLSILGICLIGYIIYTGFICDELHTFMVGGKSSDDLDVLTSNRMERNHQGLEFLMKDPFNGEQTEESGILLIHNYILLRLVRYGVWSLPLVGFYLYFGIKTICALFKDRKTRLEDVGYIACALPLLVSFVEPNFPYGPGSIQMLAFLLLGATFNHPQRALPSQEDDCADKSKKVLHICNDFTYSKVHTELYQQLDKLGVEQIIYSPIRNKALEGNNRFEGSHTETVYSFILKPLHRIFFNRKIDVIDKDICKNVDLSKVGIVHATNLFSDGAAALQIKRRYGLPYIVAVRNSDLNAFLKLPHLWWVHRAVIREAEKVIFISPSHHKRLSSHWTLIGMRQTLAQKNLIMPNGINQYWLEHLQANPEQHAHNHGICYVGNFDDNKNVLRLIEAVLNLKATFPDIHLDLVGGTGNREQDVLHLVEKHPDTLSYKGKIYEKDKLQNIYQSNSIFAMPSIHETFGLVYVEALSQGLSILYTKNEGIDGIFDEKVGESVHPTHLQEIIDALRLLLSQPNNYEALATNKFDLFSWRHIATKYQEIYSPFI